MHALQQESVCTLALLWQEVPPPIAYNPLAVEALVLLSSTKVTRLHTLEAHELEGPTSLALR